MRGFLFASLVTLGAGFFALYSGGAVATAPPATPILVSQGIGSAGDSGKGLDPATAFSSAAWTIHHATCAGLVHNPDAPAPLGTSAQPDAADTIGVSGNGLTYTFNVRSGFGFSLPSSETVTAASFQRAIERFAKLAPDGVFASMDAVDGIAAYRAGTASSISGVNASGNTLTIQLTRKDGGLLPKLTMPFFCAVPVATPLTVAAAPISAAGPYYISSASFDGSGDVSSLSILKNPNYGGDRPHVLDAFTWNVDANSTARINAVTTGAADYTTSIPVADRASLATNYGAGSPADLAGHRQYFTSPLLGIRHLALNTDPSSTFTDVRLRKAVNTVLDRPALAAFYGDEATSHYLPPSMPGFGGAEPYALGGDVAAAQALATQAGLGPSNHAAVDFYTLTGTANTNAATAIVTQLSQIWIDVAVHQMSAGTYFSFLNANPTAYDIAFLSWISDFPDPAAIIEPLLNGAELAKPSHSNHSRFNDPYWNNEFAYANELVGDARGDAYGNLDLELATGPAPLASFSVPLLTHLFSDRLGCIVLQPVYGLDLPRLCERQAISPGNPVSTGSTATPSAPLQTQVSSPNSGTASVTVGTTAAESAGYGLLGSEFSIEAPAASAASPLSLQFLIDATALAAAGVDANTVAVLRNGGAMPPCSGSPGTASPDPCVSDRQTIAGGDAQITVLTSHASTWSFGAIDTVAPTTGSPSLSDNTITSGESTTVSISASDGGSGLGGAEFFVTTDLGAGNNRPMMLTGGTFISAPFGSELTPGTYTIGVRVRDKALNWSGVQNTTLTVGSPTAVVLRSFTAHRTARGTVLRWRTASEAGVAGFRVYRGAHLVRARLIPATGYLSGGLYTVLDGRAGKGRLVYRLLAVRRDGRTSLLGVTVTR